MKTENEQLLFVRNSLLSIHGADRRKKSCTGTNIEYSSPVAIDITGRTIKKSLALISKDIEWFEVVTQLQAQLRQYVSQSPL